MNPSDTDERCLPSGQRWAKRTERQDFIDICASPPSDGFYHSSQHRMHRQQHTAIGGCVQETDTMGQNLPKIVSADKVLSEGQQVSCPNTQTTGFFKSFAPAYPTANGAGDVEEGSGGARGGLTGRVLNMSSAELERWTRRNVTGQLSSTTVGVDTAEGQQHPTDDSAPTPIDHLVTRNNQPSLPTITKTVEGGSLRLIEKYGTPDTTPCTTPAVTPVCSPQVPRRPTGNPFFSGDSGRNGEGSWLFRSATTNESNNVLYEARMDTPNSTTQTGLNNVRYVPRPSHLRELNCWSPTSM